MATVVDSNLWIDFSRVKAPAKIKQFILPHLLAPDTYLIEPVKFEVLRFTKLSEIPRLQKFFDRLILLDTPGPVNSFVSVSQGL